MTLLSLIPNLTAYIARLLAIAGLIVAPISALAEGLVVDGHSHQGLVTDQDSIRTSGLDQLHAMGYQVVVHALPVDRSSTEDLFGRLSTEVDYLRALTNEEAGFYLVSGPGLQPSATASAKIGLLFAMEWSRPTFEEDPSRAFRLRELGIRTFGLPNEDPDRLFQSAGLFHQLSPFGRRVVSSLNEAGVMIDLTHLTHERKLTVIAASSSPTVVTHGNVRAAAEGSFNLPDEVLEALATTGGHVWASFNRNGVLEQGETDREAISRLVDHIEYLASRLSVDHIGIGTDLQADGDYVPQPLFQSDTIERVRIELLDRGFATAEVDGILGMNILRALALID